jgi:hypothetical protein
MTQLAEWRRAVLFLACVILAGCTPHQGVCMRGGWEVQFHQPACCGGGYATSGCTSHQHSPVYPGGSPSPRRPRFHPVPSGLAVSPPQAIEVRVPPASRHAQGSQPVRSILREPRRFQPLSQAGGNESTQPRRLISVLVSHQPRKPKSPEPRNDPDDPPAPDAATTDDNWRPVRKDR